MEDGLNDGGLGFPDGFDQATLHQRGTVQHPTMTARKFNQELFAQGLALCLQWVLIHEDMLPWKRSLIEAQSHSESQAARDAFHRIPDPKGFSRDRHFVESKTINRNRISLEVFC